MGILSWDKLERLVDVLVPIELSHLKATIPSRGVYKLLPTDLVGLTTKTVRMVLAVGINDVATRKEFNQWLCAVKALTPDKRDHAWLDLAAKQSTSAGEGRLQLRELEELGVSEDEEVGGRYQIMRPIGGSVVLAHDRRLDRIAALKVIASRNSALRSSSLKNAQFAAQLSLSVPIIDLLEEENRIVIVMERQEYGNLFTQSVSYPEQLPQLFDAACIAVHELHERGVMLHLNLKAANLLVHGPPRGTVEFRLTDFLCHGKGVIFDPELRNVRPGYYHAPECRASRALVRATDVYGLATSFAEILMEIDLETELRRRLVEILTRATAEEVSARYSDIEALRDALSRVWGAESRRSGVLVS